MGFIKTCLYLFTILTFINNICAQEKIKKFSPIVAVATFTGPNYLGQFNFYQNGYGRVTATGAIHRGLEKNKDYHFKFYSGPNCQNLGKVLFSHEFSTLRVHRTGGTAPIQEVIEDVHLSGENGLLNLPWVLANERQNLACVMLKKVAN